LGRGFSVPVSARRAALAGIEDAPARLLSLIPSVLLQGGAVTLVCERAPEDLPDEVEVQPMTAFADVVAWADYLALDVARESLSEWRDKLSGYKGEAQLLVRIPMPCGGVAECGVCAVNMRRGWAMACKDGPVFDLKDLFF
jgi:dihydroorotate dehydrogenase electron transfer subunit